MIRTVPITVNPDLFLPCYSHLLDDDGVDIDLIYGSRDSGKSRDVAQRLVLKCLQQDYFRYILARKTFNTIKDSQWQVIKDIVEDWELDELFSFKINPLEIHCVNGNRFMARGFDDPQKVKSIQNPSGAWVEEGDQLSKDDWITLLTSLRSNKGSTKVDVTFNPQAEGDYREFWLYKDYFSHTTEKSFRRTYDVSILGVNYPITYRATHTTYKDNPFCSPQRVAIYEDLKHTSPYHYRIYALGDWGNRENKSPFVLSFDREKHLGKTVFDPEQPLYVSFDFNRNPMCCSLWQWDRAEKVDCIEVVKKPNSTVWAICDHLKLHYPNALFIICGDFSGSSQSALVKEQDLNNYYKVVKQELDLNQSQLQYIINPPIENNQVLINHCFRYLDITINPDTCHPLIFDIEFAEIKASGKLRKDDRENPTQQLDALDTMRYFFNKYFSHLNPIGE